LFSLAGRESSTFVPECSQYGHFIGFTDLHDATGCILLAWEQLTSAAPS